MFFICVFRRFGIAVPMLLFFIGLVLDILVDRNRGEGYYFNHVWTVGLGLLLTGIFAGIINCLVDPPPDGYVYSSLQEIDLESAKKDVRGSLERFVVEGNRNDTFFFVPLNRWALALIVVGFIMMVVDLVMPK